MPAPAIEQTRYTPKVVRYQGVAGAVPILHLTGNRVNTTAPIAGTATVGVALPVDSAGNPAIMAEIRAIEAAVWIKYGTDASVRADATNGSQLVPAGERQFVVPLQPNPTSPQATPYTFFSVMSQSSATSVTVQIEALE